MFLRLFQQMLMMQSKKIKNKKLFFNIKLDSDIIIKYFHDILGRVAQLVEQLTFNQWVTASNPVALTTYPSLDSGNKYNHLSNNIEKFSYNVIIANLHEIYKFYS